MCFYKEISGILGKKISKIRTFSESDLKRLGTDGFLKFVFFTNFRKYSVFPIYCKSSIKPPGAYLISDIPEGVLIERGLIHKIKRYVFGSFSVLLSHILRNQYTILRLK